CEYTIIGDVVNLSARLMQAAHGGILCGETTYRAAQERLHWQILEPITVKGKARPVAVYRPLGPAQPAAARHAQHAMVGRVSEQERLRRLLQRLTSEQKSGVVLIEGEAGIGKSRLVSSLVETARELGLATMLGAADAV